MDTPLKPGVALLSNAYDNLSGGQRSGLTGLWNLYGSLRYKAVSGPAAGHLSAFAQVLASRGGFPSSYTGDAQGTSNIEAPHLTRVYEAWVQYNGRHSRWSVLLGRYDLNSEFDRLQTASLFLDSSFGVEPAFSQSGGGGPSIFPRPRMALRVALKLAHGVVWRSAVVQGGVPLDRSLPPAAERARFGDALFVTELALLRRGPVEDPKAGDPVDDMIGRQARLPPYSGKLALGAWRYARRQICLEPSIAARACTASGAYLLLDDPLLQRIGTAGRQLAAFAQLSVASGAADRFHRYVGVGLSLTPLFDAGADDALGLAVATVWNGRPYLRAQHALAQPVSSDERIYELTYQRSIGAHLTVQPDLQYVVHPDTRSDVPDALALQFEVQLSY
ncbi:carbohydrate porin [Dyella sp. A6]|uniref:carbohydrate porin n=1 Tax=Dyella aluminiiresistens TaxID=3069105 RepID=UPI002E7AAEBB|nr:carbohydrate porin [Dyella sp. A6]